MPVIFSFDIGLGSLGIAVRKGHDIVFTQSLLVDVDVASTKEQAVKRGAKRTREAKKKRIKWLEDVWSDLRLDGLLTSQDEKLKREFPKENNSSTVYTSSLLRIQLLQGKILEPWQIYKAIRSSFRRRGYDKYVLWKSENQNDGDTNDNASDYEKNLSEFEEDLRAMSINTNYHFPCYYDAYQMGLWEPSTNQIKLKADHEINRARGYVASRYHVEKEIHHLLLKAGELLPQLKGQEDYIMYGNKGNNFSTIYANLEEDKKASNKDLAKIRYASEKKHEGVLAQKKPRFDNRQVSKCCLISKFQVCRADVPLVIQVTYLMKLRNLSFYNKTIKKTEKLNLDDMRFLFQRAKDKLTKRKKNALSEKNGSKIELSASDKVLAFKLTKAEWKKWLKKTKSHCDVTDDNDEASKANIIGRSRFSKPALVLMKDLLLSGENPHDFLEKRINERNSDCGQYKKFKLDEEDFNFLKRMENDWSKIHIPSISLAEKYLKEDCDKKEGIKIMIGHCHDPIVRYRLTLFYKQLEELIKQYGEPTKIVMEFIREDFMGQKKKDKLIKFNKEREKENEEANDKLQEVSLAKTGKNKIKMKLIIQQKSRCPYTGDTLSPSDFDNYEIDHIIPREGVYNGPDAIWNKVLTTRNTNQKKLTKAPFEFISSEEWGSYVERVNKMKFSGVRSKKLLLARSRSEIEESLERYYGLAMTSWIARIARDIACLRLGWQPGEKGEIKQFHVISGGLTAKIRRIYRLNSLLGEAKDGKTNNDSQKKDRGDKRHHALDAMVLAYLSEYYRNEETSSYFKFPKEIGETTIDVKQYFEKKLSEVHPTKIAKSKPTLGDSIYGGIKHPQTKEEIAVLRTNLIDHFGDCWKFNYLGLDQKTLKKNIKKESQNMTDLPIYKPIDIFIKQKNIDLKDFKKFLEELQHEGLQHSEEKEKIATLKKRLSDLYKQLLLKLKEQLPQKLKKNIKKESQDMTDLSIRQQTENFAEHENYLPEDLKEFLEELQPFAAKEEIATFKQELSDLYELLLQKLKKDIKKRSQNIIDLPIRKQIENFAERENFSLKDFKKFLKSLRQSPEKGSHVKKIRVNAGGLEDKINLSTDKDKLSEIHGQYFGSKTVVGEGTKQHGFYFYRDDKNKNEIQRYPVRAFHSPYKRKQELKEKGYDILWDTLFYAGMLVEITEGSSTITKGIYTIQGFSNQTIIITNQKGVKSKQLLITKVFQAGMMPYFSK